MFKTKNVAATLGLLLIVGCGEEAHDHGNEEEVITTVVLTFTPSGGGTPVVATWNDADGDGGGPPTVDAIALAPGAYTLGLKFENRLEMPAEDVTQEILDEADEHQLFFTGTAVNGPASNQPAAPLLQAYGDMDVGGLPVGLSNSIVAASGTGTLTVTLRHLPPVNGMAAKTAGLADSVEASGLAGLPGDTDVSIDFSVTVN